MSAAQVAVSEHMPDGAEIVTVTPATEQEPLAVITAGVLAFVDARTVNVPWYGAVTGAPVKLTVGAVNPFCVTVICWPSTLMCATRAEDDVFWVNEKPMTPLVMAPIESQVWSLVGAKMPARDVVAGST